MLRTTANTAGVLGVEQFSAFPTQPPLMACIKPKLLPNYTPQRRKTACGLKSRCLKERRWGTIGSGPCRNTVLCVQDQFRVNKFINHTPLKVCVRARKRTDVLFEFPRHSVQLNVLANRIRDISKRGTSSTIQPRVLFA